MDLLESLQRRGQKAEGGHSAAHVTRQPATASITWMGGAKCICWPSPRSWRRTMGREGARDSAAEISVQVVPAASMAPCSGDKARLDVSGHNDTSKDISSPQLSLPDLGSDAALPWFPCRTALAHPLAPPAPSHLSLCRRPPSASARRVPPGRHLSAGQRRRPAPGGCPGHAAAGCLRQVAASGRFCLSCLFCTGHQRKQMRCPTAPSRSGYSRSLRTMT